jgi:hypothetical protein
VAALADPYRGEGVTKVAGIEARGFILAAAVAVELSVGFVGASVIVDQLSDHGRARLGPLTALMPFEAFGTSVG